MLNLCPECHMPVSDKAEDCPHCGYVLRQRNGQASAAKAPGRVCDYCKMENPGDVMFCVSCGAPIKVAKAAPPPAQPAPQPINGGYAQQSSEVKIKYEKTERTFSSTGGTPVMINQGGGAQMNPQQGTAFQQQGAAFQQNTPVYRQQKPPIKITVRTVFGFILLALQWALCLILTLFAVVLATVPSNSCVGLAGAAVFACPLIKKLPLPFKIHPAVRAVAVFVLFMVALFMD